MGFLDKVTATIRRRVLSRADSKDIYAEYYHRSAPRVNYRRQAESAKAKAINDWQRALMAATDPDNPRRGELMRFYSNLLYDNHLTSCIDNRILPVQCAPFKLVDKDNNENREAHRLLEKPWYLDASRIVCDCTFEGTQLLEMFDLNEKGELAAVNKIPQANFIPQAGIIVREEWDQTGTSYKEGFYKDYYVQVGGDWNLGMLNRLAFIILAKKLGLGSWLSYIDKYGVPPLFAITDRLDPNRRDELFEMLQDFRQNQFAVLQGSEKIEVPTGYNVDAHNTFKSLITDIANAEISKATLGSTGMTDEKSFVGSAEVGERLFQLRVQVDKLLWKYYFNEEIRPRLVKLSPIYAPLANLTFEYDETETLSVKEIIDAVAKLSGTVEFDPDELAKITGLPITGLKNLFGAIPEPEPDGGGGALKKKIAPADKAAFAGAGPFAATWDTAVETVARQLFRGEIAPDNLDKDCVLKTYAALNNVAATAWGEEYYTTPVARHMRDNLMKFAGAKAYNMLSAFFVAKSAGISENEFVKNAQEEARKYNTPYLEAETAYVAASANSARDWQKFAKDKDIYQNLRYRTMDDENVRESHAALNGTIRPVGDSYWNTHTPPLGFRCRCWLEQTNEPATGTVDLKIDPQFKSNPGKNGTVFNQYVSYFDIPKGKVNNNVRTNTENMKRYSPYKRVEKNKEYNIYVSDFSDPADLELNLKNARIMSGSLGKDIYILPHANDEKKNPEYGIGKPTVLGDLKTFTAESTPRKLNNFLVNSADSSRAQGCAYLVLNLDQYNGVDLKQTLIRRFCGTFKTMNKNIKQIVCIRSGKIVTVSRQQIIDNAFAGLDGLD